MQFLNKVVIAGHLGRDPQVGATPNGILVAKFSVAVESAASKTTWFPCLATGDKAEFVSKMLHRGNAVRVEGALESYKYTAPGAKEKSTGFRILVDEVRPAPEWRTAMPPIPQSTSLSFDFTVAH